VRFYPCIVGNLLISTGTNWQSYILTLKKTRAGLEGLANVLIKAGHKAKETTSSNIKKYIDRK